MVIKREVQFPVRHVNIPDIMSDSKVKCHAGPLTHRCTTGAQIMVIPSSFVGLLFVSHFPALTF